MLTRYRPLLPTLMLTLAYAGTLLFLASYATANGYSFAPTWQQYGGLAAVLLLLGSFFWLRRLYRYLLFSCFILANLGAIQFLPARISFGLSFGEINFGLTADGFLLGLLTYALYHRRLNVRLLQAIGPHEQQPTRAYQEAVGEFRQRFQRKTPAELGQLATDEKLVPAAQEAARQLLQPTSHRPI